MQDKKYDNILTIMKDLKLLQEKVIAEHYRSANEYNKKGQSVYGNQPLIDCIENLIETDRTFNSLLSTLADLNKINGVLTGRCKYGKDENGNIIIEEVNRNIDESGLGRSGSLPRFDTEGLERSTKRNLKILSDLKII